MAETLRQAYEAARRILRETSSSPDLDARLLLQHVVKLDHASFIARADELLTDEHARDYAASMARRSAHEPVSRIIGTREFYGRSFAVTPDVLDPRPDTETLITIALNLCKPSPQTILDIGSGSGAIVVTLLAEWPQARGVAVDISRMALAVTSQNAARHGVADRITCLPGDVFGLGRDRFDLIVSNPPYIPHAAIAGLAADVRDHDPHLALDGGEDGLRFYRMIAAGAAARLTDSGRVIVEIGAGQAADVESIFAAAGFALSGTGHDLAGWRRALAFEIKA